MSNTNYPDNSRSGREDKVTPKTELKPEPRVKKVVAGKVIQRKKPLGRRISETLFSNSKGVWLYVVGDILVPAAKDMVVDAAQASLERTFYGESRPGGRRPSHRGGVNLGHTAYNRFSQTGANNRQRDEGRNPSRQARATHSFSEIILETRGEATDVIDQLFELTSKFESATVADLYDMVNITGDYTDTKWGWYDLRGAGVERIRSGYLLDLPRPVPLD